MTVSQVWREAGNSWSAPPSTVTASASLVVEEQESYAAAASAAPSDSGTSGAAAASPPASEPLVSAAATPVEGAGVASSGGSSPAIAAVEDVEQAVASAANEPAGPVQQSVAEDAAQGSAAPAAAAAAAAAPPAEVDAPAAAAATLSPPMSMSFAGINYDTSRRPQPECSLAAGINHIVTTAGGRVRWYDKNGTLQHDESLNSFFRAPSSAVLANARVVYDQVNNRFVAISAQASGNVSSIPMAVSKGTDPNHGWHVAAINSSISIDGVPSWAEFPGLATDGEVIYVTALMRSIEPFGIGSYKNPFQETHLWIVKTGAAAGGLYDGGPMQVSDFSSDIVTGGRFSYFGHPAQVLSSTPGALGTYLVNATGGGGNIQLVRIDNPATSPSFQPQSISGISSSGSFIGAVTQPGTSVTIEATTVGNAVWQNGKLYVVSAVEPTSGPDTGLTTAQWEIIDTSNLDSLRLADQGHISGSLLGAGLGVETFLPSISASRYGDFLVNFNASGPNLFAGSYYVLHAAGDAPGTVQMPRPLHVGEDTFALADGAGSVLWGDYNGGLDPTDGATFWIFNQYAAVRAAGQTGNWGTHIGAVPALPAQPGLVDAVYYYATYPDVAAAGANPTQHYNTYGWKEGRNPNAYFSTIGYLNANPDVRAAGMNPLSHYEPTGWREGRDPGPGFDTGYYLAHAPDVRAAGINPLLHYLVAGQTEGRLISPAIGSSAIASDGFDAQYYLMIYADVAAARVDPHQHYLNYGWLEGRIPNAFFNTNGYLAAYSDVKAAGVNPLVHYDSTGWREGRDGSPYFDTKYYLIHSPDVAAAGMDPLKHYLVAGLNENRLLLPAVGFASQITATDFDPEFYRLAYPEIVRSGVDPYTDFNNVGWQAGRNPNGLFDTQFYLSRNPDVAAAGINPLLHFSEYGWREGRDPSARFSTGRYLAANPDVAAAGINPLHHFLVSGLYEGRIP